MVKKKHGNKNHGINIYNHGFLLPWFFITMVFYNHGFLLPWYNHGYTMVTTMVITME